MTKAANPDPLKQGLTPQTESDPTDFLKNNWDQIELYLEKRGKFQELESELREYISDIRDENRSIRKIRRYTLFSAALYIAFINALAICIIFYRELFFTFWGEYTRATFFIIAFGSSSVLLLKLLVSVFRSREDRNRDTALPPGILALVEAVKTLGS